MWRCVIRLDHKGHCSFLLILSLDHSLWGQPVAMTWGCSSIPNERPTQWGTNAACQQPMWSSNSHRSEWDGVMALQCVNLTRLNYRIPLVVYFQVGLATGEILWDLEGRRRAAAILHHVCFVVGLLTHPVNVMQGLRQVCVFTCISKGHGFCRKSSPSRMKTSFSLSLWGSSLCSWGFSLLLVFAPWLLLFGF